MSYKIKKYSLVQARKLGVKIQPSTKGQYKIDIFDKKDNYITSIGNKNYSDYPSYLETDGKEYAETRRRLYRIRHSKDKGIKGFYAMNILW